MVTKEPASVQSHSVKIWLIKLPPRYFSMCKTSRAAFASQPAPKRVGVNVDDSLRRATDAERQGTNANETPDADATPEAVATPDANDIIEPEETGDTTNAEDPNGRETPDPDPNTTNVHAARGSGTLQKQMRVSVWMQKVSTLLN